MRIFGVSALALGFLAASASATVAGGSGDVGAGAPLAAADAGIPLAAPVTDDAKPETKSSGGGGETFRFETEVGRLMDIIVHSLYRSKEVFLRELISNASDALDKIRFLGLKDKDQLASNPDLKINVIADPIERTLTITDSGVGMTKTALRDNLGTIAKSGTNEFIRALESNASATDANGLIGQFGVGFYSVFLVADSVKVYSKNNADEQYIWESTAKNDFKITKDPNGNTLGRGSKIVIYLKPDAKEFLDQERLRKLILKYSEFINFPIYLWATRTEEVPQETGAEDDSLEADKEPSSEKPKTVKRDITDWELVNENKPIWTRPPSTVTNEEYKDFYRSFFRDIHEPTTFSHFHAEGETEFRAMIYIPDKPHPRFMQHDDTYNTFVKLFVRRVFITDELSSFLPRWLSFIRAVIDSDDLPLNVSRETLQTHGTLKLIRKKLIRKIIDMIKKLAENSPEKYQKFYQKFSLAIKYGAAESGTHQKHMINLLRFPSSASKFTSLDEYVDRMRKDQPQIYITTASSVEAAESSPFVEKLVARGYEVLYMADPTDEYLVKHILKSYRDKPLQNVGVSGLKYGDEDGDSVAKEKDLEERFKPLTEWFKNELKDYIDRVTLSTQLTTSSCAVLAAPKGMSANEERLYAMHAATSKDPLAKYYLNQKRVFEINPEHPIILGLLEKVVSGKIEDIEGIAFTLFESTAISSGWLPRDPKQFMTSVDRMLRKSVGVDLTKQADATVKPAPERINPETEKKPVQAEEIEEINDSDLPPMHDEL